MSLYRKYRPQKFIDLIGQEHIKQTLSNALMAGQFSHAYIFAGPKGSGKTTTARLLAKALNCTGRSLDLDSEPCDQCPSCLEVTKGQSMDVVEIDAASNRGIDEIRDLREKVKFAPTTSKFKVYVIDECHMLTKEAFNALLKTLEEPPKHAVFILATTELHKVPATILSRAQLFDFKKAKVSEIMGLLEKISQKEKIAIEFEALELIARLAYGAYRDALTLLDQVATLKPEKNKISLAQVQNVLGQATAQSVWDLAESLSAKDRSRALNIVNEVYFEGKDLGNFTSEVIELLRKIILAQTGLENQFDATKEEKVQIKRFAEIFSCDELIRMIEKLSHVISQVKVSVLGQLPLEMAVFEFTKNEKIENDTVNDVQSLKQEKVLPKSEPIIQKSNKSVEKDKEPEKTKQDIEEIKNQPEKKVSPVTGGVQSSWQAIVKNLRQYNHAVAAMLSDAVIREESDEEISLGVKFKFQADQICSAKIRPIIEKAILEITGLQKNIKCKVDSDIKVKKPVGHEEVLLDEAKEVFESE